MLAAGERPFAGGMSVRSTNWSDSISSTRVFSSAGKPGDTTTVLRVFGSIAGVIVVIVSIEASEAGGGMLPKGAPVIPMRGEV